MVQLAQIDIADETTEALERAAQRRGESVDRVLRSLLGIDRPRVAVASPSLAAQFEPIWDRIQALAGTEFTTRSGQEFNYAIEREYLLPSTSEVRIPVSQFRRAFAMGPVRGPSSLRGIFGPSIVWAVLNDTRVRGAARIVDHTWPDDGGADIADLSGGVIAPSGV
ncbi:MAG: hypothetical protein HY682_00020 [Chloroflexi bacterium]|nr:hypothetical protein [Chloroflexota bacterium]